MAHLSSLSLENFRTFRERVEAFIAKHRPDLSFDVCIALPQSPHKYHDRHIFTNYGFLKSGSSFNYFGKDEKIVETVSTTLDFHPVADSNELSIAREKLEDVSEAVPATLQAGTVPPIAGDSQNKLLDCEF
jgi:hypothetical protein